MNITFTPAKMRQLKALYEQACDEKQETFLFEGHEMLIGYAKYLIEYLESRFLTSFTNVKIGGER